MGKVSRKWWEIQAEMWNVEFGMWNEDANGTHIRHPAFKKKEAFRRGWEGFFLFCGLS
jgi:hypothetical protein